MKTEGFCLEISLDNRRANHLLDPKACTINGSPKTNANFLRGTVKIQLQITFSRTGAENSCLG